MAINPGYTMKPDGGQYKTRIPAGSLNTTLAKTAIGDNEAQICYNCSTENGEFGIDTRYRRWQSHPVRRWTTGSSSTYSSVSDAASVTTQLRTGATVTLTPPGFAQFPDTQFATVRMTVGDKTNLLYAATFNWGITFPPTALVNLKLKVLRHAESTGLNPLPVFDDFVQFTKDGVAIGAQLATNTLVPETDGQVVYNVSLAALGVTVAELQAGRLGVLAGWSSLVDPHAYDASNWNINISPLPATNGPAGSTALLTSNPTATITATYIGPGAPPPSVDLSVYSSIDATGRVVDLHPGDDLLIVGFSGVASVADGLGGTDSGPVSAPAIDGGESRHSSTTKVRRLPVVGGVATTSVTLSGSIQLSTCAPGNYPAITPTVSASISRPTDVILNVNSLELEASYTVDSSTTVDLEGARGLGFGEFGGAAEYVAAWGQGIFSVADSYRPLAMGNNWSSELAGKLVDAGDWFFWSHEKSVFAANVNEGVYYKPVGSIAWNPLYKDTQSAGNTGSMTADPILSVGRYLQHQVFIPGTDTVSVVSSSGGLSPVPVIDSVTGLLEISTADYSTGNWKTGFMELEIVLATPLSFSDAMAAYWEIIQTTSLTATDIGNDGFDAAPASNSIKFINSTGTSTAALPLVVQGELNKPFGTYRAWVDLSSVPSGNLTDIKKIRLKFGIYQTGKSFYRLVKFYQGGLRYHDTSAIPFKDASELSEQPLEYAFNYTEGTTVGQAFYCKVTPQSHLGSGRDYATLPYAGSVMSAKVPIGDAPFTPAATINLYRKVGTDWHKINSSPNTSAMIFEDHLRDSAITAGGSTYPVTVLNFDAPPPSFSGVVLGINCGASWKGSNCYGGMNGKLYMSRTNKYDEVLWDNVVLTNDPGSVDLGPPRTLVVADDTVSPILALVSTENLYVFTRRECYVLIGSETAFKSSFPRKIDSARGVLGIRASCAFSDRALFASDDGIWLLKKSTTSTNEPDELIEVTKEIRSTWLDFVSVTPEAVVVRQHLNEIWAFNGARTLHRTKSGRWIEGRWADNRKVVDATSDPFRGLVMQMSDGSLGVLGRYKSDGGTDVAGVNGEVPMWLYRTGRSMTGDTALRAVIYYESSETDPLVTVSVLTGNSNDSQTMTESGQHVVSIPFNRVNSGVRVGGKWAEFDLRGTANETVHSLEIASDTRAQKRGDN